MANQFLEPYYRYKSLEFIRPTWSWGQKIWNIWQCYTSFFNQRLDTLLYLFFGYFPFKPKIVGLEYLTKHLENGVIFIGVHSSSYPLAGKIIKDLFPDMKLTSPFYFHRKFSIFPIFKRLFAKLDISVVPLGGAMKTIDQVLKSHQSVCLFLDAELPVKHTHNIRIFDRTIPLTTGPSWLARKYQKPILPFYVKKTNGEIKLEILSPIICTTQTDIQLHQKVADSLEVLIESTLDEWQVTDRFLLPDYK